MKYALLFISLFSFSTLAIDNPDAPNRIEQFKSRIFKYEQSIQNASSTIGFIESYYAYEQALDKELNQAYSVLISKLDGEAKTLLKHSQRQWIKYRDAEFSYIVENWSRKNFGSSYALSRGSYKTAFIRSRVEQLLHYSANYL